MKRTRAQLQSQAFTRQPPTLSNGVTLAKWGLGADAIVQELKLDAYFFPPDAPEDTQTHRAAGWFTCLAFILSAVHEDDVANLHDVKREALRTENPAQVFHQMALEQCHHLTEADLVLVAEYVTGVELSAQASSVNPRSKEDASLGKPRRNPGTPARPRRTPPRGKSSTSPNT